MDRRYTAIVISFLLTLCSFAVSADTQAPDIIPEPEIPSVIRDLSPLAFRAADEFDLEPELVNADLRDSDGQVVEGLVADWGDRCPEGYLAKRGGVCEKVNVAAKNPECPTGYTLEFVDGSDRCEMTRTTQASKECPQGYALSSDRKSCEKTETVSATPYCDAGWALNGTTCERTVTQNATYSCPDSYSLSGTTCSKTVSQPVSYECPAGYTRDGTTCTLVETQPVTYECATGYTLDGTSCSKVESQSPSYSCPTGYTLSGTTCTRYLSEPAQFSCPAGYTQEGDQCFEKVTKDPTYTCPEDHVLSPDGSQCESVTTTQVTCPDGYTYENGACQKPVYSSGYPCKTSNGTYEATSGIYSYCNYPQGDLYQKDATQSCPTGYVPHESQAGLCVRSTGLSYSCPSAYEHGWVEEWGSNWMSSGVTGCASSDRVRSDDIKQTGTAQCSMCYAPTYYMNASQGTKTCPSGYQLNSDKTSCINVNDTVAATDVCTTSGFGGASYHPPVNGECFVKREFASPSCGPGGEVNSPKYSSITTSNYTYPDVCVVRDIATGGASCGSGYEVDGTLCASTDIQNPEPVCDSGYEFNSQTQKCETTPVQTNTTLCPSGFKLADDGLCKRYDLKQGLRCPGGTYDPNGGTWASCVYPNGAREDKARYESTCPSDQTTDYEGDCAFREKSTKSCPSQYDLGYGTWGTNPSSGMGGTAGCAASSRQSADDEEIIGTCLGSCPPPVYVNDQVASISCPSGYELQSTWTLNGRVTACFQKTGDEGGGTCSGGYSFSTYYPADDANQTCWVKTAATRYGCPTGYVVNADSRYYKEPGAPEYYYGMNVNSESYTYEDICVLNDAAAATQGCASGYIPDGSGSCINATLTSADANCPSGYTRDGDTCLIDETTSASPVCASGYSWNGSSCERTVTKAADPVCPSGYTRNGDTCTSISTVTADSVCPTGYSQSGSQCYTTVSTSATPNCPTGYSLAGGGVCEKEEAEGAMYQCNDGYNLDGTNCWRIVTESYYFECQDGTWDLNGSSCSRLETETPALVCPEGYEDVGDSCQLVETAQALQNNLLTVNLPKVWPGSYTLALSVRDDAGNEKSELFELNYQPQTIALRNNATKLELPAVQHAFKWEDGAATLVTDPIEINGSVLADKRPVYVGVSADAQSGYNVAGTDIAPGEYKEVNSAYDFGTFKGSLELLMYPLSGEASSSDIVVSIGGSGEAASVIEVNAWAFTGEVKPSAMSVMQIFEELQFSAGVTGTTPCTLTGRDFAAETGTELKDPYCFIEWDQIPAAMEKTGEPPRLEGKLDYDGPKEAGFTAYLIDRDGNRIEVGRASAPVDVQKAMGSFEYGFNRDMTQVLHTVEEIRVGLDQIAGPDCQLTMDEDRAIDYAQNGYGGRLCYLEWFNLPGTLAQAPERSTPELTGRVFSAGVYDLGFRVFAYTSIGVPVLIGEQTLGFEAVDPPKPSVEFLDGNEIVDGLYEGYLDSGRIASALIKSKNADLEVVHQVNNDVLEERLFEANPWSREFSTYQRVESVATELWQRDTHTVTARYVDLPAVMDSDSIESLSVPGEDIGPVLRSDADYVLNDDLVNVSVRMGNVYQDDLPYNASTMGEWEIRIVKQKTYDTYEPLTEWKDHDAAGKVDLQIDLDELGIKEGFARLYAEARVKSPVPEYSRLERSTRPVFLTILYGGEIDADIDGRRISGPVPFRGVFKLDLSDRNLFRAIGDVVWKMSTDGGATWVEKDNNARNMQYFDIMLEEPGTYLLKAELKNRNSGVAKETSPIEVVAYRKPEVTVDWLSDVFVGEEVTLDATVMMNGVEVTADDVDIEWSNDGGETFVEGGLEHLFERTTDPAEPRRERWEVRVKSPIAPADDPLAWTIEDGSISYRGIRGPRLYIQGPRVTEVGKAYTFDIYKGLPYSRMEYEIEGYFTLPNGTQVPGDSVVYTPTEEDLETKYVNLQYTGWVKGWKEQGATNTDDHALRIWEYKFPEFIIYGRYSADVAPVEAILYARPIGLSGRLEDPVYEWDIPAGIEIVEDNNPIARKVIIPDPGEYEISVKVTDRRNNEGGVTEVIEVGEPEPYELNMRLVGSNEYNRAPYEILARPDVDGGHPRDKIVEYNYTVDGQPMELVGRYGQSVLDQGDHTVRLEIVSEFGFTASTEETVTVYENRPPVCALEVYEGTFRYTVRNVCNDPDGYVSDYEWWINGEPLILSGYRISIPKETNGKQLVVESRGTDDSGLSSELIETKITMPSPAQDGEQQAAAE